MEFDPVKPSYSTADETSFAWRTVRERWPVVITQAIDDVYRSLHICKDLDMLEEGKKIIEYLAQLKYDVQHDRKLQPIQDDDQSDIISYNNELKQLGYPSWLNVPWLFAECYLYRRMSTSFQLTIKWKSYDIFARQKIQTFRSSRPAVLELAARYRQLIHQLETHRNTNSLTCTSYVEEEALFAEMCEICLWGNATDLSLLTDLTYEDIQMLQSAGTRRKAEANILVNDLPRVFAYLYATRAVQPPRPERRVDFILDNAGFELYVDLILASFLLRVGLATLVVLHPKNMPWFVSDVISSDFSALLDALSDPKSFYESPSEDDIRDVKPEPSKLSESELQDLCFLFKEFSQLHGDGKIVLSTNSFWTMPGSFWRLPHVSAPLFAELQKSELVIFKGDLNYRKLTGDSAWPPDTPFTEAIGPLGPGSGVNVLALRTCKADVVVGLPPGKDEELKAALNANGVSSSREWAWNGKWAVISFSQGK